MNLLVKIGLVGLLAGGTATALYAEPAGGWLSPNGLNGAGAGVTTMRSDGPTGGATGAPTPPGAGMPAAPTAQSGDQAGVTVGVTLSLGDIQVRVRVLHEQMRADARHIQHLQQMARKEKDVIKLNCVNDKLVQVKPEMNIADAGESELEAARDTDRMDLFDGIQKSAETIRRLREEADQCIGEPITSGGESSNSFTGPDAPDDPTKGFQNPEIEPPGYASPYT
jgi:hypothetical protein